MPIRTPFLLLLVTCWSVVGLALARGPTVTTVTTDTQLISAIDNVQAGDIIEIAGTIRLTNVGKIRCDVAGTITEPIIVRGATDSLIEMDSTGTVLEGFLVTQPYWIFENITIDGVCNTANHPNCEHAWHVVGDADYFVLRGCQATNFNAQLKSNIGDNQFPDDCLIERSSFYDTAPRQTSSPVTKLNIDGGDRWLVRQNYIGDGEKALNNFISYQAFMKSNGADGIFEQNVVVCQGGKSTHSGGTRIGLSFGGGGTTPDSVCGQGTCNPEHRNGIMRNNVIINCNDVGIYLNEASNTRLMNNLLYDTTGIDVRFASSTATITNNILAGGDISDRDEEPNRGSHTATTNWLTDVATLDATFGTDPFDATFLTLLGPNQNEFVAAGTVVAEVEVDFCGAARSAPYDIGPVQDGGCEYWKAFGAGAQATIGGDGDGDGDAAATLPVAWMDASPMV